MLSQVCMYSLSTIYSLNCINVLEMDDILNGGGGVTQPDWVNLFYSKIKIEVTIIDKYYNEWKDYLINE